VVAVIVVLLVIPSLGRSTQPPLPPPPAPYVVQAGDTLQRITDQSGVSLTDLLAWNPTITDPNYIEVGETVLAAAPAS